MGRGGEKRDAGTGAAGRLEFLVEDARQDGPEARLSQLAGIDDHRSRVDQRVERPVDVLAAGVVLLGERAQSQRATLDTISR